MNRRIPNRSAVILATLLLGAVLNACGGGGGGDTASDAPTVLPSSFIYQIRPLAGGPLTAAAGTETLQFTGLNMNGTYDRTTEEVTLINGGNPGPLVTLVSSGLGTLPLGVIEELRWVGGQDPTRGVYTVVSSATNYIRVAVDNTVPGVKVDQMVDGLSTGSGTFPWLEFENLYGTAAPAYQQTACYTYGARGLIFEQAGHMIDAIELITSREGELAAGPVTVLCDPYPPPAGARGTIRYEWIDASGDGTVGSNDTFAITFDQCWVDDPADDIDKILNGSAMLSQFADSAEAPVVVGGDMSFSNFVITETEEVAPGVFTTLTDTFTINGGFELYFFGQ
ncbi:MAG TPA: hypothetical protein VH866_02130 [Candidatus Deferrimicrobiaceae bacterium]